MITSITAENVTLKYRVRRHLSLTNFAKFPYSDSRIEAAGRSQHIRALDQVSFILKSGDRLGLVGHNGAGKTTLLKVLYGIYEPSGGSIRINGRIDALFNINLGFRPEATGRRNILLRGLINGWSEAEVEDRMEGIIEFSELGDFIDMPLKAYSQGMATRLAFAVATSLEPEILLMDEWIGAGDAAFQRKAQSRMSEIAEKAGIIVLASHNHALLKKSCNKILQLELGKVKALTSVKEWEQTGW